MMEWKPFAVEGQHEPGQYLVTDGTVVELAELDSYSSGETEWFLKERTCIDGIEAITHFAKIKCPPNEAESPKMIAMGMTIQFDYVNWQGVPASRKAEVQAIHFGATEYHPEPQWLMSARDTEKQANRVFAMKDMTNIVVL